MPDSMDIATFHELSGSLCVVCSTTFESIIDRPEPRWFTGNPELTTEKQSLVGQQDNANESYWQRCCRQSSGPRSYCLL